MTKAIRWTEDQLAAFQRKDPRPAAPPPAPAGAPRPPESSGKARMQALGRQRDKGMNKTEARYAQRLEAEAHAGRVLWWAYEAVKLRLADKTFYTPDFMVMLASGEIEFHEVKGFMMDDANVKVKVAGEKFPIRFIIVRASGDGFTFTEVGNVSQRESGKKPD